MKSFFFAFVFTVSFTALGNDCAQIRKCNSADKLSRFQIETSLGLMNAFHNLNLVLKKFSQRDLNNLKKYEQLKLREVEMSFDEMLSMKEWSEKLESIHAVENMVADPNSRNGQPYSYPLFSMNGEAMYSDGIIQMVRTRGLPPGVKKVQYNYSPSSNTFQMTILKANGMTISLDEYAQEQGLETCE